MSPPAPGARTDEMAAKFEQQARGLLEQSVLSIDSRVRSRLNQARHAAVEEALRGSPFWRRFSLMPTASAVAAAVLVAFVLWPHSHQGDSIIENGHGTVEDLDLLADGDALDLVSDETDGGQFYEWAVDQTDSNNEPSGTGA